MKKLLSLILAIVFLFSFTACAGNQQQNVSADTGNTDLTTAAPEETTIERPDLPEVQYNGYQFRILIPQDGDRNLYRAVADGIDEANATEEKGEPINDALYRRNRKVEELFGVEIISERAAGAVVATVRKAVSAGDDFADVILAPFWDHIDLLQSANLINLYTVPNVNLSKPWWDQGAVEATTFMKNKLYYACGDINYFDDYAIMALYFNKKLFGDRGIEFPYQLVNDGKWTFAEFSKITKDFTADINGDAKLDENDQWGMTENTGALYHFMVGFGEKAAKFDENGVPYISADEQRSVDAAGVLYDYFSDKNSVLLAGSAQLRHLSDPYVNGIESVFRNGRALFYAEMLGKINSLRTMQDDFGVLPQPKMDENQKNYYSFTSYGWATAYSIPITTGDLERTGVILEALAGYSMDTLTPALYDVCLNSKYTRDDESIAMLDVIFRTKTFDMGIDYNWGDIQSCYNILESSSNTFVSNVAKKKTAAEKAMEKTISVYNDLN